MENLWQCSNSFTSDDTTTFTGVNFGDNWDYLGKLFKTGEANDDNIVAALEAAATLSGANPPATMNDLTSVIDYRGIVPQGKLFVMPAYYQTASGLDIQLDSADDGVSFRWTHEADCMLNAISIYTGTVVSGGNINLGLYNDAGTLLVDLDALNSGNGTGWVRKELKPIAYATDLMTSNTTPVPNIVASTYSDEFRRVHSYQAFDQNTSTIWYGGKVGGGDSICLMYDFGEENSKVIGRYGLVGPPAAQDPWNSPSAWTFQGSNSAIADYSDADGVNGWAVLDTQSGISRWYDTLYWFETSNLTEYRKYRFRFTDCSVNPTYMGLMEARLVEYAADIQLYEGKTYEVRANGSTGKDFSLLVCKETETVGSAHPDGCSSKFTTNNWATSSGIQQDGSAALWNVILNSTEDHVPVLTYWPFRWTSLSYFAD